MSSPENRQATAAEYLAATDAALELGDQLARHPLLKANIAASQELANSKRNLLSLQWYADRAELGPAATLADVARESRPKITIPGTQHALPMATAPEGPPRWIQRAWAARLVPQFRARAPPALG